MYKQTNKHTMYTVHTLCVYTCVSIQYIYIYICVCVCVYTYVYINIYINIYVYTVCVCMYFIKYFSEACGDTNIERN